MPKHETTYWSFPRDAEGHLNPQRFDWWQDGKIWEPEEEGIFVDPPADYRDPVIVRVVAEYVEDDYTRRFSVGFAEPLPDLGVAVPQEVTLTGVAETFEVAVGFLAGILAWISAAWEARGS